MKKQPKLLQLCTLVLLLAGCGGGSKTIPKDAAADIEQPEDVPATTDQIRFADVKPVDAPDGFVPPEDALDLQPLPDADLTADVWQPTPCGSHADCPEGFCVEYPPGEGTSFCAPTCVEECPGDWVCKSVYVDGPDPVSLCVPPESTLCRGCQKHADCIVASSLCIKDGGAYGFCGKVCNPDDSKCPEGFACGIVEDDAGDALGYQCQPVPGSCCVADEWADCDDDNDCTSEGCSPSLGCTHEPFVGACEGDDPCKEYQCEGTECVGTPITSDYTLDGKDDDCDGLTDEDAYKKFHLSGIAFVDGGGKVAASDDSVSGYGFLGGTVWDGTLIGEGFRLVSGFSALWKAE